MVASASFRSKVRVWTDQRLVSPRLTSGGLTTHPPRARLPSITQCVLSHRRDYPRVSCGRTRSTSCTRPSGRISLLVVARLSSAGQRTHVRLTDERERRRGDGRRGAYVAASLSGLSQYSRRPRATDTVSAETLERRWHTRATSGLIFLVLARTLTLRFTNYHVGAEIERDRLPSFDQFAGRTLELQSRRAISKDLRVLYAERR